MKRSEALCLLMLYTLEVPSSAQSSCEYLKLAPTEYYRMFALTVLNPADVSRPTPVPNSTCLFKQMGSSLVIRGRFDDDNSTYDNACHVLPSKTTRHGFPRSLRVLELTVQNTGLRTLERHVFASWSSVQVLEISMNYNLTTIVPGAFSKLTDLWNLTISDNLHLGPLHPDTFKGLTNLRGLRYLRNNVKRLSSVTVALTASVLHKLTVLDLTGNNITRIERNDLAPMENSSLDTLIISLTKTEWIDRRAFDPLKKLVRLVLARNNLNTSVITSLLSHIKSMNVTGRFTHISVKENALGGSPRSIIEAVAPFNILLELQNNHIGIFTPDMFPHMSRLKYLDLSNVMIDDMPLGVLCSKKMPKLIHLYLGGNIFSGLKSYMVPETLVRLDISHNENDLPWNSIFQIEPHVFSKMPKLQLLNLSGNKLNILKRHTLNHTEALKVLLLKNTDLNEIEEGAFEGNVNVFYLDLSDNYFPMVKSLTKDIFRGLRGLLALDLTFCGISHIRNDVFYHVTKLQYLSLRSNLLYTLNSNLFLPLPHLNTLDLRYNILGSWDTRVFQNNLCLNKTYLDYNHIQTITPAMLDDFMLNNDVSLYGNAIICDCALMNTVKRVLEDVSDVSKLPFSGELNTCVNKQGLPLSKYLQDWSSGNCINKVWVTAIPATIAVVFLNVALFSLVYYYYKYDIHFWWLKTKRKLGLLHYIGSSKSLEDCQGFKYDAFVSYCVEDEKFVEKMVYILETNCSKFKLCVFERDFEIGDVLTDRILECMECSRRTILVLTEAFAKSQWCCWEMYIAQNRSISLNRSDPNDPLILIKKSDIPESLMTPTLRYLMQTRVYLEWHDSPIRQKIFWEQLINTLNSRRVMVT